jgi:TonB family protein
MGHDARPLALATVLAALAAGPAGAAAAQTSATAAKALEDCKARVTAGEHGPAIERCTEALRLDSALFEAYLARGLAYHQLAGPPDIAPGGPRAMAPPVATEDPETRERRGRAIADYKMYFGLNPGETSDQRLNKRAALGGLVLVLSLHDVKDSAALSFAALLAQEPSLRGEDARNLARLYERYERPDLAEEAYKRFSGTDVEACAALGGLYSRPVWNAGRTRFDLAVSTLERCPALAPGDSRPHQWLAALFWDKAYRDGALTDAQKLAHADRGLTHVDRALALDADAFEALIYKALLLRTKARSLQDPAEQKRLIDEAAVLQRRAADLRAKQRPGDRAGAPAPPPGVKTAIAPRPPPPAGGPLRVGGQIKEPKKLQHVDPVYPEVAKQARVQGVVILECTISPAGKVSEVKVLRGIPLLDLAAVEAVRQWVYTPTLMNGVPSPVIMTVTVGFHLQ